jgi:hypothetical protein
VDELGLGFHALDLVVELNDAGQFRVLCDQL